LAKNHPLLDANKRAAWVTLWLFIEMNAGHWAAYPSVDEAERAVLAMAAGEWDEERTACGFWIALRLMIRVRTLGGPELEARSIDRIEALPDPIHNLRRSPFTSA
jgi:hypothetical protein